MHPFRSLIIISALTVLLQGSESYVLDGKPISAVQYQAAQLVKASLTAFKAGDLQLALNKAQEAQKLAPNFYYVLGALGITQARLGRNDEAVANLTRAHQLMPDSPDLLWSLSATLQSAGRTDEALTRLDEFLTRFPNDPKVEQGKGVKTLLLRQKQNYSKFDHHSDKDYFDEAVSLKVLRWPDNALPVKIFIADCQDVPGFKPEYERIFRQSLEEWRQATADKVKFAIVSKKDDAQVEVVWSNKQSDVSNPAEGGETRLVPHGQALSAAKIILLTNPPVAGLVMNEKIMHFVCLHELGHALGIYGHSNKPGDILFTSLPLNFENVQLSPRDAATMLRLYNTTLGAAGDTGNTVHLSSLSDIDNANDIASFNERAVTAMNAANYTGAAAILKEAVSKYPQSDVLRRNYAAALNNTGLQAMQKQQYDRAIEIFNQSVSIEPGNKTAKTNIGAVHYNQGLLLFKANKATEAAVPLKQAAQILKEVGNTEVLAKVMTLLDIVQKQIDKQPKSSGPKSSEAPPATPAATAAATAAPSETAKANRDDGGAAANDAKYIYPSASPYVHPGQPRHSPAIDSYTNTDLGTDSSSSSTANPAANPASTGNSTGSK